MKTLWLGVLSMTALALWLRLQPGSGGSPFDLFDARIFLLVPIYVLITFGLVLVIAHAVVARTNLFALVAAAAVFTCALGIIWPPGDFVAPWPWSFL
ncbi:MAG TPA: hypothetical protein VGQ84_12770 [Gaiellaceae bacterium]|nr:hypothetical protein [Gaiellaceae bacterium]